MSDGTQISWSDATWPVTTGCEAVSPGCDHCYAARLTSGRLRRLPEYAGLAVGGVFTGEIRCHPHRLDWPLGWRKPRRIFVASMSDLFHDDVPDGFIAQVWNIMASCPQHTFQILTKRHARMRSWVTRWADTTGDRTADDPGAFGALPPMPRGPEAVRATYTSGRAMLFADMLDSMGEPPPGAAYPLYDWMGGQRWWPRVLPNVWLGVSVETQQWADIRIPALLNTPAAVRWVSAEPLLGPVELWDHLWRDPCPSGCGCRYPDHADARECACDGPCCTDEWAPKPALDWVVTGGESGPDARPAHPDWFRSLRDQCQAAGVAYHLKQWGEWVEPDQIDTAGYDDVAYDESGLTVWPNGRTSPHHVGGLGAARVWRVGKRRAGRLLDGRTHDEYPDGA